MTPIVVTGVVVGLIAETLPADFQQFSFVAFGEDRRGARHSAQCGDLAEKLSRFEQVGPMFADNSRHILQENADFIPIPPARSNSIVLLELRRFKALRLFGAAP